MRRLFHDCRATGLAIMLVVVAVHPTYAACPSCGSSPCTISGSHTIGSGETCDYSGKDVILTGTFNGDNNAACYTVLANSLTVRGTLRARGSCINVNVTGNFKTEVVSNSAALVDVRHADSAGDGVFVTCGSATLNGNNINADADGDQVPLYFPAGDIVITCSGNITGTGGPFHAVATGGDDGGEIAITSTGGAIDLGSAFDVSGGGTFSFGGSITLDATGNVTVGTSSRSLQAQAAGGGFAGSVDIHSDATTTVNGLINVNGNGEDSDGGDITVSGAVVSTGTTWNSRGDQAGFGGFIDVSALTGAGTITTTSGSNSWNATGSGDGDGGFIDVFALGAVTLSGDMDVAGAGELAVGGDITIDTNGNVTVQNVSRLEADASGTDASDGTISISGCTLTVSGDIDTRNTNLDSGTNTFTYAGSLTQNSGSNILADDVASFGGNDVFCRCVDTTPADGVCDTPSACVNPPTFNGTVTPAATITPIVLTACS